MTTPSQATVKLSAAGWTDIEIDSRFNAPRGHQKLVCFAVQARAWFSGDWRFNILAGHVILQR